MNKSQELAILDDAIKQLGPDSYLGPWLSQVRGEIEQTIRSDYFPDITINAAVDKGNNLIARAESEATCIVNAAKAQAAKIEGNAEKFRQSVADAIHRAQREINNY